MKLTLVSILLRILAYVPFTVSRPLGRLMGWALWVGRGTSAKVTAENLQRCFPELDALQLRRLTRRSLQETARMVMETPAVWCRGNDWRNHKVIRWENPEAFDTELQTNAGLILLIPHFGNWEMAGMVASARCPATIIYREPKRPEFSDLLRKLRDVGTTNLVPASPKGVMAVLKTLKAGGLTIILPDQQPATQGGIFSPFFGVQAYSMTLIHRLQTRTSARILFAYARPEKSGFVMGFCPPDAEVYSDSEQVAVDAMNRTIESIVRQAPEQYQWEYKRFRKRPDGEAKFYRFR
jgi:Kdo2-lipid IVA lauroyltransferase/acyltransferase